MKKYPLRFLFPLTARNISWLAISIVCIIALLDLVGWLFGIDTLTTWDLHGTPMKIITAICFLMAAVALAGLQKLTPARSPVIIARLVGVFLIFVGGITLLCYLNESRSGTDWFAARLPILSDFLFLPLRMAGNTATIFALFGICLILMASRNRKAIALGHLLLLPITAAAYFVVTGYILQVPAFNGWLGMDMALNTSVAFVALICAAFAAYPETWFMEVFSGESFGSIMARRLLPAILILPSAIGWLRIYGEQSGFYTSGVGVALVAITYTVVLALLVWVAAHSVNKIDRRLQIERAALQESENLYHSLFDNMLNGFAYCKMLYDANGRPQDFVFLSANKTFESLTGLRNVVGKKVSEVIPGVLESDHDLIEIYGKVALHGKPVIFEQYLNSIKIWLMISVYSPQKGYFAALFDVITERKRAEKEIAHLASFPALNPNPIIETDLTGKVCYLNDAAKKAFPGLEADGVNHPFLANIKTAVNLPRQRKEGAGFYDLEIEGKWYRQVIYVFSARSELAFS